MAGVMYDMSASYKGKKYICTFDEDDQYQDLSSNELFYYHGGIEKALGDKSPFYFLVFVTFDDVLAAAIPIRGITEENYDEKFDEMIRRFESSPGYAELTEFHLDRCAKILEEEARKATEGIADDGSGEDAPENDA